MEVGSPSIECVVTATMGWNARVKLGPGAPCGSISNSGCFCTFRPPRAAGKRAQKLLRSTSIELSKTRAVMKEVVEPSDASKLFRRHAGETHTPISKRPSGDRLPDNHGALRMTFIRSDLLVELINHRGFAFEHLKKIALSI